MPVAGQQIQHDRLALEGLGRDGPDSTRSGAIAITVIPFFSALSEKM